MPETTEAWIQMCILVKTWAKPVFVVVLGACLCLGFVTLIILHKGDVIAQSENSADTLNLCDLPQAISKEDHKFLDDLVQQQYQDNQRKRTPVAEPGQNVVKADSDSKPVPRAVLVVNPLDVKRAQLVVNSRIVERADLIRLRDQ